MRREHYHVVPRWSIIAVAVIGTLWLIHTLSVNASGAPGMLANVLAPIVFGSGLVLVYVLSWGFLRLRDGVRSVSENEALLIQELEVKDAKIEVLRSLTGFRSMLMPKILLLSAAAMFVSALVMIFILRCTGTDITIALYRALGVLMIVENSILLVGYSWIVYGRRSIKICTSCGRLNAGTDLHPDWSNLYEFGRFSHDTCEMCAETRERKIQSDSVRLGAILISKYSVKKEDVDEAVAKQSRLRTVGIGDILVEMKVIDRTILSKALATQSSLPKP